MITDREERRRRAVMASMMSATWLAELDHEGHSLLDLLMPGVHEDEALERFYRAAEFMRLAHSDLGEVLFRWMAQAKFHAFPEDSWRGMGPVVRLYFDATARLLAALGPLLDPDPSAEPAPIVANQPPRREDLVMLERVGGRFEKTYNFSTENVVVQPAPAARESVGEMFRRDGIDTGEPRMPTAAEMASMSPEERRRFIRLDPRFSEGPPIASKAPAIDGFEREEHATPFGPATVLVPRATAAPQRSQGAGAGEADPSPALPDPVGGTGESEPPGARDAGPEGGAQAPPQPSRRKGSRP